MLIVRKRASFAIAAICVAVVCFVVFTSALATESRSKTRLKAKFGGFGGFGGWRYYDYVVEKKITPRYPSTEKSCRKVLGNIKGLSKTERDVLGKLEKKMCHTKILFVFFGTRSYGNKCIAEKLLRETIGGLWDGNAQTASDWLIESVKKIKAALPTSFEFPGRFTHLERIVGELTKRPSLAKSMNERNEHKIDTYKNEIDKLADQMEEEIHDVKVEATKKTLQKLYRYRGHSIRKTRERIKRLSKCLEKGVGACQAEEEKLRRVYGRYKKQYTKEYKNNPNIQKIQKQKEQITHRLGLLRVRYRGINDAEAFFKLLESYSCLPKTLRVYAKHHRNTVKQAKGHKVDIVGRISRNVCLDLKKDKKYCSTGLCKKDSKNKYKKLDCKKVLRQTKSLSKHRKRKLLQSGYSFDYSALWDEFASNALTNGECAGEILQDVEVYQDGSFQFECSKAERLCDCIVGVGETGHEAHFFSSEEEGSSLELTVFKDDDTGYVSYEIMENGEALAYGDVNEGDVEDATGYRRRLLQTGRTGGS